MAKEYSRTERINQLLVEEISRLLRDEVKDKRIGMVTITDVETTPDLKYATVYFQVTGDEERKAEANTGLTSAAGFMRSKLGKDLHLRRIPELRFELDRTVERAARIERLLAEVREDDEDGDDA